MNRKKFSKKGFVLSMEACFTLIIFFLILFSMTFPTKGSLRELIVFQQENDLLRVWSKEFPTEEEIIKDTEKIFSNAVVFINEKEILIGEKCFGESIASEAKIINNKLEEKLVRIVVYSDC